MATNQYKQEQASASLLKVDIATLATLANERAHMANIRPQEQVFLVGLVNKLALLAQAAADLRIGDKVNSLKDLTALFRSLVTEFMHATHVSELLANATPTSKTGMFGETKHAPIGGNAANMTRSFTRGG